MPIQADLIAAVQADPDDLETQLVLADWLQSIGDERGELIALDLRDRTLPGGLTEPAALERLLLLAAEYGFPSARDPRPPALPFSWAGSYPVQGQLHHGGHHYRLSYRNGVLRIAIYDDTASGQLEANDEPIEVHPHDNGLEAPAEFALALASSGDWTDDEARVILGILSDAICVGTPLRGLVFPYDGPPLPYYPDAPRRIYALPAAFRMPRSLVLHRYGLAARDYHRWHALWNRLRHMIERGT